MKIFLLFLCFLLKCVDGQVDFKIFNRSETELSQKIELL
ncbi:hypothetical protein CAEBREN_22262 [Caenorhabditis brenneri]|uniref:Uncharacterized protein n=1 Tax=Caenorhabditis brenneri TaxID=135651 RepID=G0MP76_CAEBE|nr:hypothetical protein CAEBREN_22262 [Caenorhabditis brenneri]